MERITRAITIDQVENRKNEIIDSCFKVYLEKGFKETSIKDISLNLTFARSSIYNYYQTKEEIFLDLLKKEYEVLFNDLQIIFNKESLTVKELAFLISEVISKRIVLLQIISTSLNDLEKYSRIEFLVEFKKSYGKVVNIIQELLKKFTSLEKKKIDLFIEMFFPFLFGLCAYTIISPRQKEAMEKANLNWQFKTTQELCNDFIYRLIID